MLAALLIGVPERRLRAPSAAPTIALQLVETKGPDAPVHGQRPRPVPQPAAPAKAEKTPAKDTPAVPRQSPPEPPRPAKHASLPPPAPAKAQAMVPPPSPAAPKMELNLGGGDSLTNAIAQGPNVVQAKPDQRFRNRQPVYPYAAAAFGEQGTVVLLVHVGPDGSVVRVDVVLSSGFPLLDHAARDAVEAWHYMPAVRDGVPIPSEMPLRVVFKLNEGPPPTAR